MTVTIRLRALVLAALTVLTSVAALAASSAYHHAQAAPQVARCWIGWEVPHMQSRTSVAGEATFVCQHGYSKAGVPNLNERILEMEIEATFRMMDPVSGRWVQVGPFVHDVRKGAGTIRLPLRTGCTPTTPGASRLWEVHVTYAVGLQSEPEDGITGRSPGDVPTEFYGVSSRTAELPCSA